MIQHSTCDVLALTCVVGRLGLTVAIKTLLRRDFGRDLAMSSTTWPDSMDSENLYPKVKLMETIATRLEEACAAAGRPGSAFELVQLHMEMTDSYVQISLELEGLRKKVSELELQGTIRAKDLEIAGLEHKIETQRLQAQVNLLQAELTKRKKDAEVEQEDAHNNKRRRTSGTSSAPLAAPTS